MVLAKLINVAQDKSCYAQVYVKTVETIYMSYNHLVVCAKYQNVSADKELTSPELV
jgi:hypothetical protein